MLGAVVGDDETPEPANVFLWSPKGLDPAYRRQCDGDVRP